MGWQVYTKAGKLSRTTDFAELKQACRTTYGHFLSAGKWEEKRVYGYQIFGSNISVGNISLCYSLRRCCKENGTKIDMAVQVLGELPEINAHIIL